MAKDEKWSGCSRCDGVMLADTENWKEPLCANHYDELMACISGKENVPKEWHNTIDYVAGSQIDEGFHVHSVKLVTPRHIPKGAPSMLLEFELVPIEGKIQRTVVREFNAKRARRYVESLNQTTN